MKIIITEEQYKLIKEDSLKQSLLNNIKEFGVIDTVKFMGGYDNFITILPDYFDSRQSKIELIIEIIKLDEEHPVYGGGGRIYLHELDSDILYDQFDGEDGHTFESYIDFIENYNDNLFAHVTVWEFDEDGTMYDEYYSDYDVSIGELETKYLNKLFEMLLNYYL